eukprot:11870669-Alexandrium_andersonii.AAC.1
MRRLWGARYPHSPALMIEPLALMRSMVPWDIQGFLGSLGPGAKWALAVLIRVSENMVQESCIGWRVAQPSGRAEATPAA